MFLKANKNRQNMQNHLKLSWHVNWINAVLVVFTDSALKISDYSIDSVHSETLIQSHYYQRCLIISVIQDTPFCLRSDGVLLFSGWFSYCLPQVCEYTHRIAACPFGAPVLCRYFFKYLKITLYIVSPVKQLPALLKHCYYVSRNHIYQLKRLHSQHLGY